MTDAPINHTDIINQLKKIQTAIHQQYNIPYHNDIMRKINQVCDGWIHHTTTEHLNQLHIIQLELHNDYDVDLDSSENGSITDLVELVKKYRL